MTERIRVLLADDHNVVRAGLHAVLATEPDLAVVGECATAEEAVRLAAAGDVDVVLMDLQFGDGMDGATATAAITAAADAPRVLVLTTYDADADILAAIEAGASGYLLKDAAPDDLTHAIRAAANGRPALAPSVANRLMDRMRNRGSTLSPRDRGAATRRRRTVQRHDQQADSPQPGDGQIPPGAHLHEIERRFPNRRRRSGPPAGPDPPLTTPPRGVRRNRTIRGAQPEGVVVGADVSPHSWMKRAPWALKSARGEEPERPGSAVAKRRNQTRRLATPRYPCTLGRSSTTSSADTEASITAHR